MFPEFPNSRNFGDMPSWWSVATVVFPFLYHRRKPLMAFVERHGDKAGFVLMLVAMPALFTTIYMMMNNVFGLSWFQLYALVLPSAIGMYVAVGLMTSSVGIRLVKMIIRRRAM